MRKKVKKNNKKLNKKIHDSRNHKDIETTSNWFHIFIIHTRTHTYTHIYFQGNFNYVVFILISLSIEFMLFWYLILSLFFFIPFLLHFSISWNFCVLSLFIYLIGLSTTTTKKTSSFSNEFSKLLQMNPFFTFLTLSCTLPGSRCVYVVWVFFSHLVFKYIRKYIHININIYIYLSFLFYLFIYFYILMEFSMGNQIHQWIHFILFLFIFIVKYLFNSL